MIETLLLLQLAHHPTIDSGRGLSLLRAPSIPLGNAQQTLGISGNLWRKEILPLKWILRNTHWTSPYSPNLSSQERVKDVQPSKVPESTPRCVYPV